MVVAKEKFTAYVTIPNPGLSHKSPLHNKKLFSLAFFKVTGL
jgi:hypothetical protein